MGLREFGFQIFYEQDSGGSGGSSKEDDDAVLRELRANAVSPAKKGRGLPPPQVGSTQAASTNGRLVVEWVEGHRPVIRSQNNRGSS